MTNIYGNIKSAPELAALQANALPGAIAIGITDAGAFYRWNNSSAVEVKEDEVKQLLELDDFQFGILKSSKGLIRPDQLYPSQEVVTPLDEVYEEPVVEETIPEQSETAEDVVAEDEHVEEVPIVEEQVETPKVEIVEITREEYDRLLEVQEHDEFVTDELATAKTKITVLSEELDSIKNAASVIAKLIK